MQNIKNLIVIGASAGGIQAVAKVISGLSPQMDAAVMVVLHVSAKSSAANIAEILQRHTTLHCTPATDGALIEKGTVYLAIPEHHLMVSGQNIVLSQGPHENKYRPAIDILFRSAAVNYGNRVIGIILTGLLEDGTSGMYAIQKCGGYCIVQDPAEAEYPDMPLSVLNTIKVDYKAKLEAIPAIVQGILNNPPAPQVPVPEELKVEAAIAERMMSNIDNLKLMADYSDFICPDCGGGLWEVKDDPVHRYRCHTGHVYTERLLSEMQDKQIEESVWVSIRLLEERYNMLTLMANRRKAAGEETETSSFTRRINDTREHINRLKLLLVRLVNEPGKEIGD